MKVWNDLKWSETSLWFVSRSVLSLLFSTVWNLCWTQKRELPFSLKPSILRCLIWWWMLLGCCLLSAFWNILRTCKHWWKTVTMCRWQPTHCENETCIFQVYITSEWKPRWDISTYYPKLLSINPFLQSWASSGGHYRGSWETGDWEVSASPCWHEQSKHCS